MRSLKDELRGMRRDNSPFEFEVSCAPTFASGETSDVAVGRNALVHGPSHERDLDVGPWHAREADSGLDAIAWEATTLDREVLSCRGGQRATFLGYPHSRWAEGGFWLSIVDPADRAIALTAAGSVPGSDTVEIEYRLIGADGVSHDVRDTVFVVRDSHRSVERLFGVMVDITKSGEREIELSQRPTVQVAEGLAHDFNNLLAIMSGHALRLRQRPELASVRDELDQIVAAGERAVQLTDRLLTYAQQGSVISLVDPRATIRQLRAMLRRLVGADITVSFQLDAQTPSVLMDNHRLEQILMNLVVNARDAMSHGGTLIVRTGRCQLSGEGAEHVDMPSGNYSALSISDTGVGIAPEIIEHVFEPCVSTKPGKGAGTGLWTVYAAVKQAGGRIDVESVEGRGTTFRVLLPAAATPGPTASAPPVGLSPTVLLVEDDRALRRFVLRVLQESGYVVLEAADGPEAVSVIERHRGPLDLLITDVSLPNLTGPELAQHLRLKRRGLHVLFMSGYNATRPVETGDEQVPVHFLTKPFTPDELISVVGKLTTRNTDSPTSPPDDGY
jgi:two-component system cell cycle sensor histidine kinase/response regulator CckA